MDVTFPNASIYEFCHVPADKAYDHCEFPQEPQIVTKHVGEVQTDRHASWAFIFPEVNPQSVPGPREILRLLVL
jgi:hypothetical protein